MDPARTKRVLPLALVAILVLFAGSYFYFKVRPYKIVITQADINDALAKQFPVTKPVLIFYEITLSKPAVTLLPAHQRVRVSLVADVKFSGQARTLTGSAQLTARVNYHPDTQEFFLDDPKFENLDIGGITGGIPPQYLDPVNRAASAIVQEYVQRYPIYHLKDYGSKAAQLLVKNVEIRNREVVVTMGL